MKLRKLMAGAMAAAMMMTSAIVCPYYASAACENPVAAFSETVLGTFTLDSNASSLPQYWPLCEVSLDVADQSIFTADNTYVKVTLNYETAPGFGDGNATSATTMIGWGWGNYSWANCGGWFADSADQNAMQNLVFATSSTDNTLHCYLPISDFTAGDSIHGFIKNFANQTATLTSVELVEVDPFIANQWTLAPDGSMFGYLCEKTANDTDANNGTPISLEGVDVSQLLDDGKTMADVRKIDVTVAFKGGNGGGSVGLNGYTDDTCTTTEWKQTDSYNNANNLSTSIELPYGAPDDCYLKLGLDWVNYNSIIELTLDFTYAEVVDVPATSVTIDSDEVTLDLGIEAQKTATLTATVEPDDTTDELAWTTSDDTVVTVEDGVLTAVGIGTATITATAGEQSDTCAVTVQKTSKITADYDAEQGTVTVAQTAVNGEEVTVTATPNAGYKVSSITIGDTEITDGKFTMPAEDVTVVVTFEAIEYTITVADTTNGTVTAEPTTSVMGVEILITAKPDTYYVVDTMTATTAGGANVTITDDVFTMPADDVTVNVTFALNDEALAYDIYQAVEPIISGEVSSSTYKDKAAYVEAIEAAIADIEFDGLTVNGDNITFTAPEEGVAGSITGKIVVSSGDIFKTEILELNVTIKAIPSNPVELAAEALEAFLATYKATNDTHATALAEEMKAMAAEASPNAITDINILVTNATYTEAGNVHFVIKIKAEGYDIKEITKDLPIAQLEKTDAMLIEEAKAAAEAAIADIENAEDITKALITEAIANADITVDVKSEETTAPTTTAVGVQTVTITLTLGEESATITKTFDIAKLVAVESVSLDNTKAELEIGKTITLTATVTPDNAADKSVTWKSSDEKVATVKDGVVTAVAAGEATITVTTTDGGKTATCAVTVVAPEVVVTGISLDNTAAELEVGETVTLTATVTPDNADDKTVTWTTSDAKIATVKDGVVTAVAAGEATITATTVNGLTAECAVTVTAPADEPEPDPEPDEPDEPDSDEIVIWSGSTNLGTDWGTSITATYDVSKIKAGDTVKVYYTAGTAATYQQVKLMDASWTPLTSPTGMNEWDCVNLPADGTVYEFVISDADVKALNGTMIVSGYNATITAITVVAATADAPAGGYTDSSSDTIPVGRTMTQKTAVEDGRYNQRFVQKLSVADLENATKIVFTVSNGTKTAKYESTQCYSSLNVNGNALAAGDGYVYVVLTIKDIPEDKTVEIQSIDIV